MEATTTSTLEAGTAAINSYLSALPSPGSQEEYPGRLKIFFDFLNLPGSSLEEQAAAFLDKTRDQQNWVEASIINYLNHLKKRVNIDKNLASSTLKTYYLAVKLFYEMNDLGTTINWTRITRGLPKPNFVANDRAPTLEEIRKLVEFPERRIKPIVYVMCSSGIRLGAWQHLKWKHITPITDGDDNKTGEIIAAKLNVYAKDSEHYYTFITAEAYNALKDYMDFRASYGEKITGESWLLRDKFPSSDVKYGAKMGLATNPKQLKIDGIKKEINRALKAQNLRQQLPEGETRHPWKALHGYRKFFKTNAERVMKPLNVELLMNHKTGVSDSYWRPTEKEVFEDYLKAVEFLSINDQKTTLQKQVKELSVKNEQDNYFIKGKLADKEKELDAVKTSLENKINKIQERLANEDDFISRHQELIKRYNYHIDELKQSITEQQQLKDYVLNHLKEKDRDAYVRRLIKSTKKERKRLEEEKRRYPLV